MSHMRHQLVQTENCGAAGPAGCKTNRTHAASRIPTAKRAFPVTALGQLHVAYATSTCPNGKLRCGRSGGVQDKQNARSEPDSNCQTRIPGNSPWTTSCRICD